MFDIDIAVMRGFGVGINYTNEDIEGVETIADDLRHTIQVIFFFVLINITYYTHREF